MTTQGAPPMVRSSVEAGALRRSPMPRRGHLMWMSSITGKRCRVSDYSNNRSVRSGEILGDDEAAIQ